MFYSRKRVAVGVIVCRLKSQVEGELTQQFSVVFQNEAQDNKTIAFASHPKS